MKKVDIQTKKVDIQDKLSKVENEFSNKTIVHIHRMINEFGYNNVFGRNDVVKLLELQNSSASKLIKKLLENNIIEPVVGYGKGKYKFIK